MNLSEALESTRRLIKGEARFLVENRASLATKAQAIGSQFSDVVYLLSHMEGEDVQELDEALDDCLETLVEFAQSVNELRPFSEQMKESSTPELPKVGVILEQIRSSTADLLDATRQLKRATGHLTQPEE